MSLFNEINRQAMISRWQTKLSRNMEWTVVSRQDTEVSGRQHLRSTSRRKLNILRFRRSTGGTVCAGFLSRWSDGFELAARFVA